MTMAPGIEAAASPHGRAAAAAAAAAAAWYQQGGAYPEAPVVPQMHHSVQDPASVTAGGHPGHAGHGPEPTSASFFASSDAASRYYQMHYESAASQGKLNLVFLSLSLSFYPLISKHRAVIGMTFFITFFF